MSAKFTMAPEHAVLIDRISGMLKELKPDERLSWDQLLFVPKRSRTAWVERASKACGVDCYWDRDGVVRCNPDDESTLHRVRGFRQGMLNKAKRTQKLALKAAANLSAKAPTSLHLEANYTAGIAGSVRGILNTKQPEVFGAVSRKIPVLEKGKT